jgi:hypothetical protein
LAIFTAIRRASWRGSAIRLVERSTKLFDEGVSHLQIGKATAIRLRLTLLGLCNQLDEAFDRLNLLAFAIVELWIVAPVDGGA